MGHIATPRRRAPSFATVVFLAMLPSVAVAQSDGWQSTGRLSFTRFNHSAFPLADGRILVFGGSNQLREATTISETYYPESGTWTTLDDRLQSGRVDHAATTLADGRIFVVGGTLETLRPVGDPRIAEIFDPSTSEWSRTDRMGPNRYLATATLLADGRVLVAGGDTTRKRTYQIYDPESGSFAAPERMPFPVHGHSATLLPDGRVLVAGGERGTAFYEGKKKQRRAFLFDPASNSWTETGQMQEKRSGHHAFLLPQTGDVLVVDEKHSEIYNPGTGTWRSAGNLSSYHSDASAIMLDDGRVLLVGGNLESGASNQRTELFSPETGAWTLGAMMIDERFSFGAARLLDGRVIVSGGKGAFLVGHGLTQNCEIYTP